MKRALIAAATIGTALASAGALAQTSNLYGVASLGRSTIDVDGGSVNNYALNHGFTTSSTTVSDDDIAGKLQLGYRLTPLWSIETGYTYMGEAEFHNTNNNGIVRGVKRADLWNFDFVGTIPLGASWAFLGRVGGYRWETRSSLPLGTGVTDVKDDGYDVKFGGGLQYTLNPTFSIRGEFERFNGIGEANTTGDSKVNMMSLGAVLKF